MGELVVDILECVGVYFVIYEYVMMGIKLKVVVLFGLFGLIVVYILEVCYSGMVWEV